jgi:hypothetical protein
MLLQCLFDCSALPGTVRIKLLLIVLSLIILKSLKSDFERVIDPKVEDSEISSDDASTNRLESVAHLGGEGGRSKAPIQEGKGNNP